MRKRRPDNHFETTLTSEDQRSNAEPLITITQTIAGDNSPPNRQAVNITNNTEKELISNNESQSSSLIKSTNETQNFASKASFDNQLSLV